MHSPNDRPFSQISYLAVALGGEVDQTHVGLIFANHSSPRPRLLHLGFHHRLKLDDLDPTEYCWIDVLGLDEDERHQMSIWLGAIWSANGQRIPYGISFSSEPYFDSSGAFVSTSSGTGLTCATFVSALFRDFGFPILDTESWQSSYPNDRQADDIRWQNHIVNLLSEHKAYLQISDEHIASQIAAIGIACRYRPEEVAAAAAIYTSDPVHFSVAAPQGTGLKEELFLLRGRGCAAGGD